MAAIKRILVTTDFSKAGNKAVKVAFDLAAQLGARVFLATLIERQMHESRYFIDYTPLASKEALQKAVAKGESDLKRLVPKSLGNKVVHETVVELSDNAAQGILDIVDQIKPQMLVISDHGMSGLEKFLLGSTTDRVLRSITIPVVLVK